MTIEMTKARLKVLERFFGTIGTEGENGKEIVVRIVFDDAKCAEMLYEHLFDIGGRETL